tara:strand:+ start:4326 stop:5021 length:696 start_codon:yes stop_codon:yes gene_type:complete
MTKALVLTGDGINSDKELALALQSVGFQTEFALLNDLQTTRLMDYDLLAIAGGFSFADDLGSGKVAALKIQRAWQGDLQDFLQAKKMILGICNGFQVLVQLGLLPGKKQKAALTFNTSKTFINRWVPVRVPKSNSPWLQNLTEDFYLPIRHAEGRLLADKPIDKEQIALSYVENPNGSQQDIAGLVDETGLVFGLMPHPEAAYEDFQIPFKNKTTYAKTFFQNAYEYTRSL